MVEPVRDRRASGLLGTVVPIPQDQRFRFLFWPALVSRDWAGCRSLRVGQMIGRRVFTQALPGPVNHRIIYRLQRALIF